MFSNVVFKVNVDILGRVTTILLKITTLLVKNNDYFAKNDDFLMLKVVKMTFTNVDR